MTSRRGLTLIELLVIISIVALAIGILLPVLGAARRTHRGTRHSSQLRGIHTGMVLYAQGNNHYYPGLNTTGGVVRELTDTACSVRVECRFQELLYDNYFAGEHLTSPAETKTAWTTGAVTTQHYSYAMLEVAKGARQDEWRETNHGEAVVLGDRALQNGAGIKSLHTNPAPGQSDWRGNLACNDGHVDFVKDPYVNTEYGSVQWKQDDLFSPAGTDDALLIAAGTDQVTVD